MIVVDKEPAVVEPIRKNKFEKLIHCIKKSDELEMTKIVNSFSRLEIGSIIDKLKRYKYKRFPSTAVAISKLKWRRGY